METKRILINSAVVFKALSAVAAVLIAISIGVVAADSWESHDSIIAHKLTKLFYVDFEMNVPSFFSALVLLLASTLLGVIAVFKRRARDAYSAEWMILTLGFLFMAFDELISVHERLIEPMRELLGGGQLGVFYFAWVIPLGLLVLSLGILMFGFWWSLPNKSKIRFAVAGMIFLAGAIGFELLESRHVEINGKDNPVYIILTTIEEGLEMFGVILFVRALLVYMHDSFGEIEVSFAGLPGESAANVTGTVGRQGAVRS